MRVGGAEHALDCGEMEYDVCMSSSGRVSSDSCVFVGRMITSGGVGEVVEIIEVGGKMVMVLVSVTWVCDIDLCLWRWPWSAGTAVAKERRRVMFNSTGMLSIFKEVETAEVSRLQVVFNAGKLAAEQERRTFEAFGD